jgi:FkbM family methyltransferase
MPASRILTAFNTFVRDLRGSIRVAADTRSRFRLCMDFALSRFINLVPSGQRNRLSEVTFRDDIKIRYRLNKGDIHSIREIWFEEAYRLPFEEPSGVLLDLGANMGMTSVWLAKRCSFTQVIAVAPDPNNAALGRQNLKLNRITGQVLEAAIGPTEGTARFEFSQLSNLGRLSESGSLVPMISVDAIIKKFSVARFGLIKIDIEGGEQKLFDGPVAWLALTDAIIIEFHPLIVDYPRLTRLVSSHGRRFIPANSLFPDNMDGFTRISLAQPPETIQMG